MIRARPNADASTPGREHTAFAFYIVGLARLRADIRAPAYIQRRIAEPWLRSTSREQALLQPPPESRSGGGPPAPEACVVSGGLPGPPRDPASVGLAPVS